MNTICQPNSKPLPTVSAAGAGAGWQGVLLLPLLRAVQINFSAIKYMQPIIRHLPWNQAESGKRKAEMRLWLRDAAGMLLCAALAIALYLILP